MSDKEERPLPGALPCPFCGGTKITTYPGSTFRWRYAACDECGAQAEEIRIETISLPRPEAIAEADKDLLKAWNKRAPLPESQPLSGATPRTDKAAFRMRPFLEETAELVNADFARQLERDRAALIEALTNYRSAQRRMLERWAEGDENVKRDLWKALHACEDPATETLAAVKERK